MTALTLTVLLLSARFQPPGVPTIDRPVVDEARVIEDSEEQAIGQLLVAHEQRTGVQLAVLTVYSTSGDPIEDFAHRVASAWGGGTAGRDDGALFVLAIGDRRMRLELGYGLEGVIPDGRARAIIDRSKPELRAEQYAAAVRVVVDGVIAATAGLQPGQAAPFGARTVGLLYRMTGWYTLFFVLGALLGAVPHGFRKRYPGETMAAQAQRRDAERKAHEKNPKARSWYDDLPWQQRLIKNPWTPTTMGIVLWFAMPALIALTVPGVRLWNMTVYLIGGLFGILTAWAWYSGKRGLMRVGVGIIVATSAGVFLALQWQPLPVAESGLAETALGVSLIVAGIPVLLLFMVLLDTSGGSRSYGSGSGRSSSRSSASSSSSRSSGPSSYRGGGGRFGGGGASSSW